MKLSVNPNRMELLKLKRRILYAQKGQRLLEERLKGLLYHFMALFKQTLALEEEIEKETDSFLKNLWAGYLLTGKKEFFRSLKELSFGYQIKKEEKTFMAVRTPSLELQITSFNYPKEEINLDLELAVKRWSKLLPKLAKLACQLKTCQLLADEIESTRRRVNALKYLLIPSFSETVRYISEKLNDLERDALLRLLRIKEVIRKY